MTAIYGLWRFDDGNVAADSKQMDAALSRYGSDACDVWVADDALALGRRLHASLPEDLLRHSGQPDRRYIVAADVRLTERDDLARQLELGRQAERMSDADIAAAAVECWGEQAFDRIYGAFAIAAWDKKERRLILARDHLGLKPLFYHSGGRFFAFASMPAGLHALPDAPRGPDVESIKRFLALENQAPGRTHFEGISRVMPGRYAIVTPRGVAETRYWHPDLTPLRLPRHQDYVQALADELDRAVAAALRGSGNQIGAHLSSGFDSTAIATTAARQLASRGGTVVAYTAAPREGYNKTLPDRIADESVLAKSTVAMHSNMQHVVIRSYRTPTANLDRTASIYGVPVLNICNESWLGAINDDAAGRGITVMLEAPMGNATISETGMLALPELVRSGRIIAWLTLVGALLRRGEAGLAKVVWKSFSPWLPNGLYRRLMHLRFGRMASDSNSTALKDELLHQVTVDAANEYPIANAAERVLSSGWIRPTGNSLTDRLIMLVPDDSGALCKGILGEWKIDYRDPTTDRRLVEFSLRVPTEQLIHGGEPRALLRKVLADRVPPAVLNNRRRGYQAADWHEWLNEARQDVIQEISRMEAFEPTAAIIDVDRLKTLVDKWPEKGSDAWTDYAATLDYRSCLLRAISAASFMRQASADDPSLPATPD